MKGVILAAGKGTRLYPVTKHVPKPLIPVAGKPTIFYALEQLSEMGIQDVCVVVNPDLGEKIHSGLRETPEGTQVSYAVQEEPLGLAHAVASARGFVRDSTFCLYLGDAVYDQSLAPFRKRFEELGCDNLNVVQAVPDPERFGVAYVDGDRITKLVEKPTQPDSNLAMAGVYFFNSSIWQAIDELKPSARGEYEITDAIQTLVDKGKDVRCAVFEGRWFDTGTLHSLLKCSSALLEGKTAIAPDACVRAAVGSDVTIGSKAHVSCEHIHNSIVLDGAEVEVNGVVRNALLAGCIRTTSSVENTIAFGDEAMAVEP